MEYSILNAEISKATFDIIQVNVKKFKGLKRENLRDHMNDLELIFTNAWRSFNNGNFKNKNAIGFEDNKIAAQEGGVWLEKLAKI